MKNTVDILKRGITGEEPTQAEYSQLLLQERETSFGETLEEIQTRFSLLTSVYPTLQQLFQNLSISPSDAILEALWRLWLPLAMQLSHEQKQQNRPLIQGILGGQGTGKTTLAAVVSEILRHLGHSPLSLSLDDLYKTYEERQQLKQEDPRLIWRGPPGTHDVSLGIQLLDSLRQPQSQKPILIPRFDKSAYSGIGDRAQPEIIDSADIILFEGWFVGVRPINNLSFQNAPLPIITPEDRIFAQDMNQKLSEYLPLWERLDRLMVLLPVDYRLSQQWRQEAEQKMKAKGKSGMSDNEIKKFVEYFWKALHPDLFLPPLIHDSSRVNLVVEIQKDHSLGKLYTPPL